MVYKHSLTKGNVRNYDENMGPKYRKCALFDKNKSQAAEVHM